MKKTLISFDWAMKNVLRDKANFDILSGLLSELLGKKVVVQELLESESNSANETGKTNKLDLKAKIESGEIAIFEIQVDRERDFFHRILFGTSKAVVEQLYKGDEYGKIQKVYSIDIVYFELGKGSDYIYHGTTDFKGVHNDEILLLSEKEMKYLPHKIQEKESVSVLFPEYYLIYPNKFDENIKNKFDEWVYLFKNSIVDTDFSAAGIQAAGEALDVRKMNMQERINYDDYLKYERVRSNEITTAKEEGLVEGEKKGKKQKAIEIAKNLKLDGMPIEKISKLTGLSTKKIENLQ
jgi:predicted transposase/invertase (TIGR01784 family)